MPHFRELAGLAVGTGCDISDLVWLREQHYSDRLLVDFVEYIRMALSER
jgi:hypothetical protein